MKKCLLTGMITLTSLAAFSQPDKPDPRTRTYVYPTRIVAKTEAVKHDDGWPARCDAVKMELLLAQKHGQVSEGYFGSSTGTRLINRGNTAFVILDFGCELQGGVQLGISQDTTPLSRVRLRFGESVAETCAEIGEKHAANEHSLRDTVLQVPCFGSLTYGETGFRFLRIDLISGGEVGLEFVRAVSAMRPMKAVGAFRCSDERLNQIYETGVRTVHLCCQDYLWDGIKRDRLVWIGDDSYTAMKAILPIFGSASVVPETLDFAMDTTPPNRWMVMAPYTLWFVRCLADWYRYTGDLAYLRRHADYLRKTMDHLAAAGADADVRWKAGDFLDWHTHANHTASMAGLQAVSAMAYDDAVFLFKALGEDEQAQFWQKRAAMARQVSVQANGAKLPTALLVQAGMLKPEAAIEQGLGQNPGTDLSPFAGYFVSDVLTTSGYPELALATARNYFGAMIDMGATSFWEGFDIAWTNNATRIDELPVPGRHDVHGDYGEFCYPGFRNSLCHSWGAGVSAWCISRVLGIRPLEAGCKTVEVKPALGDLTWAEGAMALPNGEAVKVRVERKSDGRLAVDVRAPDWVTVVK